MNVTDGGGGGGVVETVARACRSVHWFLRELTGESAYDRYLEHHAVGHVGHVGNAGFDEGPLDRREFERRRWDRATQPGSRCC